MEPDWILVANAARARLFPLAASHDLHLCALGPGEIGQRVRQAIA